MFMNSPVWAAVVTLKKSKKQTLKPIEQIGY